MESLLKPLISNSKILYSYMFENYKMFWMFKYIIFSMDLDIHTMSIYCVVKTMYL